MQRLQPWFWLWFIVILISTKSVRAGVVPGSDLDTVLPMSDVVCVGTVTSTSAFGRQDFDSGVGYRVDAEASTATVNVESVLSGALPEKKFHLLYPTSPSPPKVSSTPLYYPQIIVGTRAMFFLRKQPDRIGDHLISFALVSSFAQPSLIVPIGNASLNGVSSATTPLRRVVLTLTRALSVSDDMIRLDCLGRIRNALSHLVGSRDDIAGFHVDRQFNRQMRSLLAEPEQNKLDGFVESQVLPSVKNLETASNPEVRFAALIAAGSLQDATVIPQLAAFVTDSNASDISLPQEASEVLASYRTSSAVVPLVLLLKDNSLRSIAADALRDIADPDALPFLLQYLNDPNPTVVFNILGAIAEATHQEELVPRLDSTPLQRQLLVAHWKKWALEHEDKIKKLHEQFEIGASVKVTR